MVNCVTIKLHVHDCDQSCPAAIRKPATALGMEFEDQMEPRS